MATAAPPDPKPVYQRAYAPKVRTGCFTCKIRRKKCDKAKPACRRCLDSGFACDGYPDAFVPAKPKRPIRDGREVHRLGNTDRAMVLLSSPSADSSLDPQPSLSALPDRHFFHHFRTITIPDFVRLVVPNDFWTAHVLPRCHTEPAVLYAAAALGAAHSHYLAYSQVGRGHPEEQFGPGCAAIQLYNRSIRKILGRSDAFDPATGDAQDLGPLLLCCVLFVCLENLLGRPQEALRHMRAGAALLTTIDLTIPSYRIPAPCPSVADHAALTPLLRASATVLSRFGIDASILQDQQVISDIRPYAARPQPLGDSSRPFSSLQNAKDAIWDLDARMAWLELRGPKDTGHTDPVTPASTPDEGPMRCSPAWARLQADFRRWSSRLNHTMAASIHAQAQTPSPELRERLMMSLRCRFWDMIMMDESKLPMVYDVTLLTVEHVYEVEQALSPRPIFTLDCDTIPMLVIIAANNEALIPRILVLLRKYQRREGMWDSARVAHKIEAWLKGGTEQMSFPELLVSMHTISCGSASGGAGSYNAN